MLDAFQASARESAERAAAERRRIVAEREREARREEAVRTAGELRRQLGGVPRSGPEALGHDVDEHVPEHAPEDAESALDDVPEPGSGPVPATFDAPSLAPAPLSEESDDERPVGLSPAVPSVPSTAAVASADLAVGALPLEDESVFVLPMSARGFIGLQALLLACAFLLGWALGQRTAAPEDGGTPGGSSAPARTAASAPTDFSALRASAGRGAADAGPGSVAPQAPGAVEPSAGPATGEGAAAAAADDGSTADDIAFRDPANRYTVLAITYISTETNIALAWETYDFLRAEGFPVVRPIERNARLHLLVGAAQSKPELDEIEAGLRSLRNGRNGSLEFRSAYKVNIDSYR